MIMNGRANNEGRSWRCGVCDRQIIGAMAPYVWKADENATEEWWACPFCHSVIKQTPDVEIAEISKKVRTYLKKPNAPRPHYVVNPGDTVESKNYEATYMENSVAVTCKETSVIIFILALIGGIIVGKLTAGYSDFNFGVAFCIWTGSFLFCLLLYAVGEIISQLHASNGKNDEIIRFLRNNTKNSGTAKTSSNSFDDLPNL